MDRVYLRDYNLQGGEPFYLNLGESIAAEVHSQYGLALRVRTADGVEDLIFVERKAD